VPKVSVIVPCYKYGKYVTACVRSLLQNTEVDLDVLVVDDRSPDDSWSVVQTLPELDPRVRVMRNERNLGLIGTANMGLEQAVGDYVVLLSSDDAHAPGWLDRAVAALEAHPSALLAYGPTRRFTGELPVLHRRRQEQVVLHAGRDWIQQSCRRGVTPMLSPEVVVRTSAQREVGGYRPELPYSSDMEMWLRLASVGDVLQVRGPVAAFYRVSAQSMSRVIYLDLLNELQVRRRAFDAWYAFADGRVHERDALMSLALHSLARRAVRRAYMAYLQDPTQFDGLCAFARENDPAWAGPQVERLHRLRDSGPVSKSRDVVLPVTRMSIRARQALTDVRAHLHIV
jgi:glycosyltransferase involved in cell wall biosynthesis